MIYIRITLFQYQKFLIM